MASSLQKLIPLVIGICMLASQSQAAPNYDDYQEGYSSAVASADDDDEGMSRAEKLIAGTSQQEVGDDLESRKQMAADMPTVLVDIKSPDISKTNERKLFNKLTDGMVIENFDDTFGGAMIQTSKAPKTRKDTLGEPLNDQQGQSRESMNPRDFINRFNFWPQAASIKTTSTTVKPASSTLKPGAASEKHGTSTGKPGSTTGKPGMSTDKPGNSTSKPADTTGKPGSTTGKPGMSTGKPGATTGKPGLTTGKPGTITSKPGATTGKPGSTTGKPGMSTGKPGATTGKPGLTTGKPGAITSKPGATTGKPGSTTGKPGMSTAKPGVTTGKPGSTMKPLPKTTKPASTGKPMSTTRIPGSSTGGSTTAKPGATIKPLPSTGKPVSTTSKANSTTGKPNSTSARPGVSTAIPVGSTVRPGSTTSHPSTLKPGVILKLETGTTSHAPGSGQTHASNHKTRDGTTIKPTATILPEEKDSGDIKILALVGSKGAVTVKPVDQKTIRQFLKLTSAGNDSKRVTPANSIVIPAGNYYIPRAMSLFGLA